MRHTMLFLPASSPRMIQSSFLFNASSVIFDLEDAVSLVEKDSARILLNEAIKFFNFEGLEVVVRVNPLDTPYAVDDVAIMKNANIDTIMLPKATKADVEEIDRMLEGTDIEVIALIETCIGVEEAFEIVKNKRVVGVLLGGEDLSVDLEVERTKSGEEILYARQRIVNACKALRKDCIDTPFTDTDDVEGLIKDTKFAKSIGFTGKSCINPRQIHTVNKVFVPTKKQIEYAERVVLEAVEAEKLGLGAFSIDGKMIDLPVINRAKKVLEIAEKVIAKGGIINE